MHFLFRNRDEQVGAQGGPNLHAYAVGIVAEKAAQSQVLFQPAPEKFYAPTAAVYLRDHPRGQFEIFGQEDERLAAFRVDVADPAQHFRIVFPPLARIQADGLVAPQSDRFVDRPGLHHVISIVAKVRALV